MLTIEEVAGLLKVSPATVRRLIERKELTKTSVLRSVRIKVSDYNRYVGGL
jgi:excisionase family DNA binding protein